MIVSASIITPAHVLGRLPDTFTRDQVFDAVCANDVSWPIVPKTTSRVIRKALDKGLIRPVVGGKFAKVG